MYEISGLSCYTKRNRKLCVACAHARHFRTLTSKFILHSQLTFCGVGDYLLNRLHAVAGQRKFALCYSPNQDRNDKIPPFAQKYLFSFPTCSQPRNDDAPKASWTCLLRVTRFTKTHRSTNGRSIGIRLATANAIISAPRPTNFNSRILTNAACQTIR